MVRLRRDVSFWIVAVGCGVIGWAIAYYAGGAIAFSLIAYTLSVAALFVGGSLLCTGGIDFGAAFRMLLCAASWMVAMGAGCALEVWRNGMAAHP